MNEVTVKPGLYEHFKGGRAIVFAVAKHTEAHHLQFVHYREFRADGTLDVQNWIRPLDMFIQRIQRPPYDGPRFWRIGTWDDAIRSIPDHAAALEVVDMSAVVDESADDPVQEPFAHLYDPRG
jgi:hypothetical protein